MGSVFSFQTIGVIVIGVAVLIVIIVRMRRTMKRGGGGCGCGATCCDTALGAKAKHAQEAVTDDALFESKVKNMHCQNCANAIKKALAQLPGAGDVTVDLSQRMVHFRYSPEKLTEQEIVIRLEEIGFPIDPQ